MEGKKEKKRVKKTLKVKEESEDEEEGDILDYTNRMGKKEEGDGSILKKRNRQDSEESKQGETPQGVFRMLEKSDKDMVNVEFELVSPSEAYYHSVRALLNQYLDGEEGENLDLSGLADNVVNTISIGTVIASSLE